jgi:formylglycine-generating enzyme required for sulfatase activity
MQINNFQPNRLLLMFLLTLLFLACGKDKKNPVSGSPYEEDARSIEWVMVKGGTYQMGYIPPRYGRETPGHRVTLNDFQISKYEVTNKQFAAFLNSYGSNKVKSGEYAGQLIYSEFLDWGVKKQNGVWQVSAGYESFPIFQITWFAANEFCRYLGYRLPTEAEWEYAARGGSQNRGYLYSGSDSVDAVAWYNCKTCQGDFTPHPVGTKLGNEIGLFDMSGNVSEWCMDWYDENYYSISPEINPQGPSKGTFRVFRGGSFGNMDRDVMCFRRDAFSPDLCYNIGFRACR